MPVVLDREAILALVPHAGTMCLLDHVVAWDQNHVHCDSHSHHAGSAHPLWRDGHIAAINLVEYGAQAAAVHAGLLAGEGSQSANTGGFLAGLRDITMVEHGIEMIAAPLDIHAWREMGSAGGMVYRFRVSAAHESLCAGRLTVVTGG